MVSDEPTKLLFTYPAILDKLDANLLRARPGREVDDILLMYVIAVVLLDVDMPGPDQFELVKMIRQSPRAKEATIIYISAVRVPEIDRLSGVEGAADNYIPVPVVPELLRSRVKKFVNLYKKTR